SSAPDRWPDKANKESSPISCPDEWDSRERKRSECRPSTSSSSPDNQERPSILWGYPPWREYRRRWRTFPPLEHLQPWAPPDPATHRQPLEGRVKRYSRIHINTPP